MIHAYNEDALAATEVLTKKTCGHSAHEAPDLVDGHNEGNKVCSGIGLRVEVERAVKRGSVDQPTHEALYFMEQLTLLVIGPSTGADLHYHSQLVEILGMSRETQSTVEHCPQVPTS